ncbi:MAG: prepilin-type N-terminal cleavage/methylation domain-containing protein [Thermosipho sp. (in: Bacteria)]|nr:prepilin-type N-terminal cleavage/methylation domain-containing protein [Thermosipho sp. (in: thermotogales)]
MIKSSFSPNNKKSYQKSGFTITELVISMLIISIISSLVYIILINPVNLYTRLSKKQIAINELEKAEKIIRNRLMFGKNAFALNNYDPSLPTSTLSGDKIIYIYLDENGNLMFSDYTTPIAVDISNIYFEISSTPTGYSKPKLRVRITLQNKSNKNSEDPPDTTLNFDVILLNSFIINLNNWDNPTEGTVLGFTTRF